MALLNITPFDINRRPGRPSQIEIKKGTPKTTATDAVKKTPEQRPTMTQAGKVDRRRIERRHRYKPMAKDRRAEMRRNLDVSRAKNKVLSVKPNTLSIDIEV